MRAGPAPPRRPGPGLVHSFRVLLNPDKHVLHLPWLHEHREGLLELGLEPLGALVRKKATYTTDFISPPPEGPYPDFDEELERVLATPHDEVAKEIEILYSDGGAMPRRPELCWTSRPRRSKAS